MIYAERRDAEEGGFVALLEKSRLGMLGSIAEKKVPSSSDFELMVFDSMVKGAHGTDFEGTIRRTGPHDFPDIVAKKYFGAEVKMTIKDQWTSTGNSVLESLRVEDVKTIYIVFGKFGGKFDVRYRLYQECLPEISVTHSPRYKINMDLAKGQSIFDKIGVDYDTLRKDPESLQIIKKYYRSKLKDGEELWWIDQDSDDRLATPIIRPFRSLSPKEKGDFTIESMILFPEMFGYGQTKFERVAAYLITRYSAVSANLRDNFTAGGQESIKLGGIGVLVPKVIYHLHKLAPIIAEKIKEMDEETLLYYWRCDKLGGDRIAQWKKMLDENMKKNDLHPSEVFEDGLLQ